MRRERPPGLFVVGTDTGVGKTHVAAAIIRQLRAAGHVVGAYKPVASGCSRDGDQLRSQDAAVLWDATGQLATLDAVCPQRFGAPLAPYLAAEAEGRAVDSALLRTGIHAWSNLCDVLIVEAAGGFMSPLDRSTYVADLARDLAYPLVVVAANQIGVIHQVLQTCLVAERVYGLVIRAVVLNSVRPPNLALDPSTSSNFEALQHHCAHPVYALEYGQSRLPDPDVWRHWIEIDRPS